MQGVVPTNDTRRRSAIDRRTTRHRADAVNQRIRKQIDDRFGWAKTIGEMPKLKHRGLTNVDFHFTTLVDPKWQEKLAYRGAPKPCLSIESLEDP